MAMEYWKPDQKVKKSCVLRSHRIVLHHTILRTLCRIRLEVGNYELSFIHILGVLEKRGASKRNITIKWDVNWIYGKYQNFRLAILPIKLVFTFTYLIDAVESKRSKNLIKDTIQGEKPNHSNLENRWDKTIAYVGGSPKCGVIRWMWISSLKIHLWIMTKPLV